MEFYDLSHIKKEIVLLEEFVHLVILNESKPCNLTRFIFCQHLGNYTHREVIRTMKGKFTNTEVVNNIEAITSFGNERLKNPFYSFSNNKGTVVTYFNTDISNMPLDTVTGLEYKYIGPDSNKKYNRIKNFVIYGFERLEVTMEDTEMGQEASEISGNAIILPNTITPYPGDYFIVDQMQDKVLFKVIDAQSDTFDNGANVWQIQYKLDRINSKEIESNIGKEEVFILNNNGTQYNCVIEADDYEIIKSLEDLSSNMIEYYKSIFYNERVQSLIVSANNNKFYDSYLTEFISRNKLLTGNGKDFLYIAHQLAVPKTFSLDYDRSFFHVVEEKDMKKLKRIYTVAYGELIDNKTSIFSTRSEPYLNMVYMRESISDTFAKGLIFEIFDEDLLAHIQNDELYGDDILADVIIKYFNDEYITYEDIDKLDIINYSDNIVLFYYVPIVIYILERYIKELLSPQLN